MDSRSAAFIDQSRPWIFVIRGALKRLPARVARRLRWTASLLHAKVSSKSIEYALFSTALDRETRAMAAGKSRYEREVAERGRRQALLRRNVHRLEKGLLMRPCRREFAVEYIEETVDCLRVALDQAECSAEVAWASDVLRAYFALDGRHAAINSARAAFDLLQSRLPPDQGLTPHRRGDSNGDAPNHDQLLALARRRRSVRWFLPRPVPRSLLERAMEVAREAPSACNRQPFVFRAFDDPAMVGQVASIPYGTSGYSENIPCVVVVVGRLRNFGDERDRHLIYIDAALAAMGFVLALETLGLSSCLINWPDLHEKERAMAELLCLEADERPVFLIAVGYPDPGGKVARSVKKPIAELLVFEAR
jgi:nitroreductase